MHENLTVKQQLDWWQRERDMCTKQIHRLNLMMRGKMRQQTRRAIERRLRAGYFMRQIVKELRVELDEVKRIKARMETTCKET